MKGRSLAAALLILSSPAFAAPPRPAAVVAFKDGGEVLRSFGAPPAPAARRRPPEAAARSPKVAALLVAYSGEAAGDREEASALLFAHGDTVNDAFRKGSGGKRGISGEAFGPLSLQPGTPCDLAGLLAGALAAASGKADLSGFDTVLVLAPRAACSYAGAATVGAMKVAVGNKRMELAAAWAFGPDWKAAAAHALEHAGGLVHASEPAAEDFGFAPEPPAVRLAWARAAQGPLGEARDAVGPKPKVRRAAKAKPAAPKPAKKAEPLLTLDDVQPFLDAPEEKKAEADLRDAPASLPSAGALGWHGGAAGPSAAAVDELLALPKEPRAPRAPAWTRKAAAQGARELREALRSAEAAAKPGVAKGLIARRRLASELSKHLASLRAREVPSDARVSLLTTEAESELDLAVTRLAEPKLSAAAYREQVLGGVARAAADLDQAAGRMR